MRKSGGFTLIEVLIATVLFGLVMLFGISFFSRGREGTGRAKQAAAALQFARDRLETLKVAGYDAINNGEEEEAVVHPGTGISFTRVTNVNESRDALIWRKYIRVEVRWQGGNGVQQAIKLNTIVGYTGSSPW